MKICHFINGIGNAGAETLLARIIEAADTEADSYTVVYLGAYHHLKDRFEAAGAELLCLDARTDPPQLDPALPVRFANLVREREFNVIHTHNPYTHILARTVGTALADVEVVSTQHLVKDALNPVVSMGDDITRDRETASVAVSRGVQRSFTQSANIYDESGLQDDWCTIYNGIDVSAFRDAVSETAPPESASSEPAFVNVGRYVPEKRQRVLVDAMPTVTEAIPEAHLYLIGGSGSLEADLRDRVGELGVSDAVTITGFVPDVKPYYALADVFVSSSVSEGLPMTILEAMSSELPVIATEIPGVTEVVADGESGYLVPPRDPAALAEAMISMADAERRDRMGTRSYEIASERFDIQQTVQSYRELYAECRGVEG